MSARRPIRWRTTGAASTLATVLLVTTVLGVTTVLNVATPAVARADPTTPTEPAPPATVPAPGVPDTAAAVSPAPPPTTSTIAAPDPAPNPEPAGASGSGATPPPPEGAEVGDPESGFSLPLGCFPTISLCVRTLTLQVNAQPDTTASFGFRVTKDLTNESVTPRVAEGTPQFVGVPRLASYKVRLTGLTDRFELRSVRCSGIRQSVTDGVVSIENGNPLLDNGAVRPDNGDISCTFTVRRPGSIQIRQTTLPSADEDFSYALARDGVRLGGFVLDNDSLGADRNDAPSSRTFGGLPAASFTISATTRAGFRLTALTCDTGETIDLAHGTASIALAQGEDVVCRFTFTELATVRLTLDTRPDDPLDIVFDTSDLPGPDTVTLDDDGLTGPGRLSNSRLFTDLLPGDIGLTQLTDPGPSGVDLTAIACDGPVTASSVGARAVTFHLDAGENLTCTFRNDRRGTITIAEDSRPDGPRDYPFTDSASPTGFTLDDDTDPTFANSITFDGLRAGTTRTFTQGVPGGTPPWLLVGIQCVSGGGVTVSVPSRSATITVLPGQQATCTFDNAQFLPDALVGTTRTGLFAGDEVRAATPLPEQTIEESVSADGRTTTIVMKVQNDSGLTDDLIVTGVESGNGGFTTTYRTGGTDVTAQVLSPGGFTFAEVAPGGERLLAIDFTAQQGSVPGTARKTDLTVHSITAPAAVDVVRARARRT